MTRQDLTPDNFSIQLIIKTKVRMGKAAFFVSSHVMLEKLQVRLRHSIFGQRYIGGFKLDLIVGKLHSSFAQCRKSNEMASCKLQYEK
jgi:hypothetical protein